MELEEDRRPATDTLADHLQRVRRRVSRLVGRRDDIEDYVQATMLEAHRSAARHGPPDYPKKWHTRIAERVVARGQARLERGRRVEVALEPHQAKAERTVQEQVDRAEQEERLRESVDLLPPHERDAVRAYYWDDRSCEEIAQQAGTTKGAIKVRLHRARQDLRKRLEVHESSYRSR